jgi:hypothetical protein
MFEQPRARDQSLILDGIPALNTAWPITEGSLLRLSAIGISFRNRNPLAAFRGFGNAVTGNPHRQCLE